ncbi:MAG: twin-arginine translocase subunit TatC [Paludibacteraceae bacterium]|nr:twin-arginine translocase subunit TatC [Paludibacteraceae bacterium]
MGKGASFWEHLDALRGVILRVLAGVVLVSIVAFCFKDELFSLLLAPKEPDFWTYRMLDRLAAFFSSEPEATKFSVSLINTQLAQQFLTHMQVSFYTGFVVVFPYMLYEVFRFVSPALYSQEKFYVKRVVVSGYLMFMLGVLLCYYMIFPLTFRFLATYQVSELVENQIVLDSYIDTFVMLSLMMGILFELPVLSWLFAKLGFITSAFLAQYRKHAFVGILLVAAFITPTSDVFTLLIVALPIYLLYEVSILIIRP